ncbi:hypothetical protein FACS189434_11040 [Bacteroidia bacterium]|nr:hypothetical protein FACS189434_11040 [Bacteroidia bacterium]
MRNLFLILATVFCVAISANAQTCTISGADDGSTVEVQSCYLSGDKVIVNVINDSKDIAANVTVSVTVTYKFGTLTKTESYQGRNIALARVSTPIEIPVNTEWSADSRYTVYSATANSVSGTKCK